MRLRGKRPGDTKRENWLLIKGKDDYADANGDAATEKFQRSVVSGRSMEGIAGASGKSWGKSGARKKSAAEAEDAVKALKKKTAPRRRARPVKPPKSARVTRPPSSSRPSSLRSFLHRPVGKTGSTRSSWMATGFLR